MRTWRNPVTSEMLDGEFFKHRPLASRVFVHVAVVFAIAMCASALVTIFGWRALPDSMGLWVAIVAVWMVLLWLRALRDHRKLRDLLARDGISAVVPGSPMDVALRVAANTMYFGLFGMFGASASLLIILGIVLASR